MKNNNYRLGKLSVSKLLVMILRKPYYSYKLWELHIRIKIVCGEIPLNNGVLIAAHHEDDADPSVLLKALNRRLNWISAPKIFGKSILDFPFLNKIIGVFGIISIDLKKPERNKGLFEYLNFLLKIGEAILIFPEGNLRHERNGKRLGKAKEGVIRIAQFAQRKLNKKIPIYPVGIEYKKKNGFKEAYVKIGLPFYVKNNENPKKAMSRLMKEIARLSNIRNV